MAFIPGAEVLGDGTSIDGLYELGGDRVAVADSRERAVTILGVGANPRVIARQGRGPSEYLTPKYILGSGQGHFLVFDVRQGRFLSVDTANFQVGSLPPLPEVLRRATPRGVDTNGRIYFEVPGSLIPQGASGDSASVYRWDPTTGATMVLTRVDGTDYITQTVRTEGQGEINTISMMVPDPFSRSDEWGVFSTGTIIVARATPFAIEVYDSNGRLTRRWLPEGFGELRTTRADRLEWNAMVGTGDGDPPTHKPVVVDGTALVSLDGYLWIRVHTTVSGDSLRYVIIDHSGNFVGEAWAPGSEPVVGLGSGNVYFGRRSADGLTTVVRRTIAYPPSVSLRRDP